MTCSVCGGDPSFDVEQDELEVSSSPCLCHDGQRKVNMFMEDGRCDRRFCLRKATRFVRDIEDIEMTRTPYRDGYLIRSQQQVGEIRKGCSWHPPAKSVYYKMEEEDTMNDE